LIFEKGTGFALKFEYYYQDNINSVIQTKYSKLILCQCWLNLVSTFPYTFPKIESEYQTLSSSDKKDMYFDQSACLWKLKTIENSNTTSYFQANLLVFFIFYETPHIF